MAEHRSIPADWVVPAILDVYTRCLNDHGVDVPRVEARRDGGFSIVVSGSMIEDGFDPSDWYAAHGACSGVAPDLFGGFFGVLTDGMLGGFAGACPGLISAGSSMT